MADASALSTFFERAPANMKDQDIAVMNDLLPEVFDIHALDEGFGDDWTTTEVDITPEGYDPIEQAVVGEAPQETLTDQVSRNPDDREWVVRIPDIPGGEDGFPGAPRRSGNGGVLPPDALAFYLPFHHFSRKLWGIYLVAEGVEYLAIRLVHYSKGRLSLRDAFVSARAFLFHHEAYHSAVEAFASRLEISHRQPVYRTGLQQLYRNGAFEEALASAYGIDRVRSAGRVKSLPSKARRIAADALLDYTIACGLPYSRAEKFLGKRAFEPAQQQFQESGLQAGIAGLPRVKPSIWSTGSYLMTPALRHKGRFTYLVNRQSSLANRIKANALYFAGRPRDGIPVQTEARRPITPSQNYI